MKRLFLIFQLVTLASTMMSISLIRSMEMEYENECSQYLSQFDDDEENKSANDDEINSFIDEILVDDDFDLAPLESLSEQTCMPCSNTFKNRSNYIKHVFSQHALKGYNVKCPHINCQKSLTEFKNILKHHKMHNLKECINCDGLLTNQKKVVKELRKQLFDSKLSIEEKKQNIRNLLPDSLFIRNQFACPICHGKSTKCKAQKLIRMSLVPLFLDQQSYTCGHSDCNQIINGYTNYLRHHYKFHNRVTRCTCNDHHKKNLNKFKNLLNRLNHDGKLTYIEPHTITWSENISHSSPSSNLQNISLSITTDQTGTKRKADGSGSENDPNKRAKISEDK